MLKSSACTHRQLQSDAFRAWAVRMGENPDKIHRKSWEWCYIAQALEERDMLRPGRRGLGFAVGQEPLTALFASRGCHVLATDLDAGKAQQAGWVESQQHASRLEDLNHRGICPADQFRQRVRFRTVDMNRLPADLGEFDFVWSSCSIEHLGSLRAGQRFMLNMTRHLKPGGVAVHTTEYNVSSDQNTLKTGSSVLFRRRDLHALRALLESLGHEVAPADFDTGQSPADQHVDEPPYTHSPHLKLRIGPFVSTSFGVIVTAGNPPAWGQRLRTWLRLLVA